MIILPIIFTFLSFLSCFFFGRLLNNIVASLLSNIFVFFSLICSVFLFYEVSICQSPIYIIFGNWFSFSFFNAEWSFSIDSLSSVMLIVILLVSSCAHIYSVEYMYDDPHQIKFMSYLSLFTFFMLILVCSNNYIILFIGWEGVGICSYLLVNFWNTRISANKSSVMAVFINKVGDICLLISFSILYFLFHSFDYSIIFSTYYLVDNIYLTFVCLFFLGGAIGKSAQLGLHIWLPEAMEGPTPVSSLIHAATMVTAGIFLVIKSNILFQYINNLSLFIIGIGSCTAFMGSSIGFFQWDIKKIIAYSTCSQLGYMFLSCGLNGFNYSINHLANHAFFKALLFLSAGYIIHALSNEQDIRKYGSLFTMLPLSYIFISIGSMALFGFPFLSGFFSKEKIIESFYSYYLLNTSSLIYIYHSLYFYRLLSILAISFTIGYSIKIIYYGFLYPYENNKLNLNNFYYSGYCTIIPLLVLCVLSIVSGYLTDDIITGINNYFFNSSIFQISNANRYFYNIIYFEYFFNDYSFFTKDFINIFNIVYFLFFYICFFFYKDTFFLFTHLSIYSSMLNTFFSRKYIFFNKNILYFLMDYFYIFSEKNMLSIFDKGLLELIGPYGIATNLKYISLQINKLNSGLIYHYSGIIVISIIIFTNIFFII